MLTHVKCKSAKSGGLKIKKLPDSGGLYLWVYEGGQKYWRFRYWLAGKEKSLSLGVFPAISLKVARSRRDEERGRLDDKLDPAAERRAEKVERKVAASNSFESVAREWFAKQAKVWAKSHADDVLRRLEGNAFPTLGRRPISEISAKELLATLDRIEKRGAYDLAHRVLQVCGQIFRYGIAKGLCVNNPAPQLRGALTPHKKVSQKAVRPEAFPDLLQAIAGYDKIGDKQTRLGLEVMALTFTRTTELILATWDQFDMDGAMWIIPEENTKMKREHVVPLARQTITKFEELRRIGGGSRFVFPGRNRDRPMSNNTMLFALYRLGYKGVMTGHGFRAVASTMLNGMGIRADVIERQLAHIEINKVRGAYNRAEYLPERSKMMQAWANKIDMILRQKSKATHT